MCSSSIPYPDRTEPEYNQMSHPKITISVYYTHLNSHLTYLKDVIPDVIDMNDGWVPITDLGAEHCPELR